MTIWLDAQLSPWLAQWIKNNCQCQAVPLRELGLRDASDPYIFLKAREADVVMTKDKDFVDLLHRHGPPPKVLWVTAGNTSNSAMAFILSKALTAALDLLHKGEQLVEITG
jgi:predicted nuclease of predicted toxin-antitoxin system